MISGKSYGARREPVSYEQILVTAELSRSVQWVGGMPIQRREMLGELVRSVAAARVICRPKDLISQEPTRHEVMWRAKGGVAVADKLRGEPLAEIPVGREVREVRLLAKLLDGFANPIRLSVLLLLSRSGEMSVGEMVEAIGAPQPRVSDHLRCLAWCGYVRARREGSNVFYSIADERVLGVLELGEGILTDNLEHVEACDVTKDC
jgi:ArsR family transcriptional regulator, cadmium/lead-responsive transcriptional repressor